MKHTLFSTLGNHAGIEPLAHDWKWALLRYTLEETAAAGYSTQLQRGLHQRQQKPLIRCNLVEKCWIQNAMEQAQARQVAEGAAQQETQNSFSQLLRQSVPHIQAHRRTQICCVKVLGTKISQQNPNYSTVPFH